MVRRSSSDSPFTAGAAGFLTLIQSFDRPNRYGEPSRFDTTPRIRAYGMMEQDRAFDVEMLVERDAGMFVAG